MATFPGVSREGPHPPPINLGTTPTDRSIYHAPDTSKLFAGPRLFVSRHLPIVNVPNVPIGDRL